MNGAAVNCQQEQALHPQHNGSSSLLSPGYLQTNYPCQEKNSQHQYSKAMNYKLLPDSSSVDGSSKYSQYSSETRNSLSNSGDLLDNRINRTRIMREPLELPVPKFEVDENSVGVFRYKKVENSTVQDSKDLDLDTRIDLLIKSKALSGMHPIFSDLTESDDSSTDSEELLSDLSKCKSVKHFKVPLPEKHIIHQERFNDPEKPLSRPPSPFLSRATYLFWFNKAIELKQQAKAQEQALIEKAIKKLGQGNLSSDTMSKSDNFKQENNILQNLLSEVSKELKESIKQDFIQEIFENTVLSSLEDWWVKERKLEDSDPTKDFSKVSSTTKKKSSSNEPANVQAKISNEVSQGQKSTTSKLCIPSKDSKNPKYKEKRNILKNKATSIIELNKTVVKKSDVDVSGGLAAEHDSVLCKENTYMETKSEHNNFATDNAEKNSLNPKEIETNISTNDKDDISDMRNPIASKNETFKENSNENLWQDEKNKILGPVNTEESNSHTQCPVIEYLPSNEKSVVKSLNENILAEIKQVEPSENTVIGS